MAQPTTGLRIGQRQNMLKTLGLTVAWLGVFTLTGVPPVLADMKRQEPAWVHKGSGIEGEDLVGVGVAQGPLADERGAYLDALLGMTQVISADAASIQKWYRVESEAVGMEKQEWHTNLVARVSSPLIRLAPGAACALRQKAFLSETPGLIESDQPPSRFAWLEQEHLSGPTSKTYDFQQKIQMEMKIHVPSFRDSEQYFESVGRCELQSSEVVLAGLPIAQRYEQRRPDGSVVSYVQVRVPLKIVLAEVQASRERGNVAAEDPWEEATKVVGKDAISSRDGIPTLSYTPPVCKESRENLEVMTPTWVTQKDAAFLGEGHRFYGVGYASSFPDVRAQRRIAEIFAREDVASSIQSTGTVKLYGLRKTFAGEAGETVTEDTMKNLLEVRLMGASVEEIFERPCTGEVYALVSIDRRHVQLISEALGQPIPAWAESRFSLKKSEKK